MSVAQRSASRQPVIEKLDQWPLRKQRRIPSEERSKEKKDEFVQANFLERLIIDAASNKQRRRQRQPSIDSSKNSYQIDRLLQDEGNDWLFEKILQKFEHMRSNNENRHARPSSYEFDADDVSYGVERIIERRYYVKKPRLTSNRHQLTSTTDLTSGERKHRQYSGESSVTAVTTVCSHCSSSTPTYVENLREQSEALRNEISDLKNEIEQLQVSQQDFFQQLQEHFQGKPQTTTMQKFAPSTNSSLRLPTGKKNTGENLPISIPDGKKSRSVSTKSHRSSSLSSSSEGSTTSKRQYATKPNAASSSIRVPSMSTISEFTATKNPTITPGPPTDEYISSESSSEASLLAVTQQIGSKLPFMKATSPTDTNISSNSPSIVPARPFSEQIGSKKPLTDEYTSSESPSSSIAATPIITKNMGSKQSFSIPTPPTNGNMNSIPLSIPIAPPFPEQAGSKQPPVAPIASTDISINSKSSAIAATPPVTGSSSSKPPSAPATPLLTGFSGLRNPLLMQKSPLSVPTGVLNTRTSSIASIPPTAASPASFVHAPIYENELAHRHVLSPRSQIIASSESIPDSSNSSSGTVTPELGLPNPREIPKVSATPLHTTDMNALVRYSSQLELSGFPASTTPIVSNPNTSSTFWDSVDQYIANSRPTNINLGLPPIPRSSNASRSTLYNQTTRQLDKYNLEIKPQEFIESSPPLLMPPLDILP